MTLKADRQHEVAFCSEISKWSDQFFQSDSSLPLGSSDIESFGRGSQKRQDFRVYERATKGRGKLVLCGEVKLPGTQQGRSPFDPALMKDAYEKATNANCQYFFTWNVEHLALFDRALWDADTMHERCVGQWELGLELNQPADVMRAEVIARLRDQFLPTFYKAFSDIWTGEVSDVSLPPSDFYITVLESHLAGPMGPVRELRDYLGLQSDQNAVFDARLREWMTREQQWNFDRGDPDSWRKVIDRAARSMVYVLSNRILFYQAVRLRNDLPELEFPRRAKKDPKRALRFSESGTMKHRSKRPQRNCVITFSEKSQTSRPTNFASWLSGKRTYGNEGLSVAAMFKKQKELAQDLLDNTDEEDDSETISEPAKQAKQSDE